MLRRVFLKGTITVGLLGTLGRLHAANWVDVPTPQARDTCPVCGMRVARYPAWIATIVFQDGSAAHFDGPKDLFKYLLNLERYAPQRSTAEISVIAVTEYYGLRRMDARTARYVVGSDVLGPMGHELIPLATQADAEAFLAEHGGTQILEFAEITPEWLKTLDNTR
jgi:copper chaperone NosL